MEKETTWVSDFVPSEGDAVVRRYSIPVRDALGILLYKKSLGESLVDRAWDDLGSNPPPLKQWLEMHILVGERYRVSIAIEGNEFVVTIWDTESVDSGG
jgi:hypothetical protein